ncbi:MAG TPA: hypothetical protein VEF04_12830 [Blastocatellia bacterium]|nr:hypothetical protein [Blastocatellia bacterium]
MDKSANPNLRLSQEAAPKGESGFTLLETAVGAMVMLVGLLAAAQLFAVAALYNHSSKQTTLATALAHRKLEELIAQPLTSTMVDYGGSLTSDAQNTAGTTNFYEDYYIHPTTKQFSTSPHFTGQAASYHVRWQVSADTGSSAMTGMRVIIVRAEATQAGLKGIGAGSTGAAKEVAQLSTIRTPPQ